jgi:hypothetical protein
MDDNRAFDNQPRIAELLEFRRNFQLDPQAFKPWLFRRCVVRVLIVADGFIDFDDTDFGLGELLRALFNSPSYVRFDVTCAHRSAVSDIEIGVGRPGVVRTIKEFKFDDANHFGVDMYDELWLVGSVTSSRTGPGPADWSNRPSDAELRAISEFMDSGRGVFATGDHGALGAALGGFVPRVRSMRRWFAEPGPFGEPVAPDMTSPNRRDTNRTGPTGGFQFDDQSDIVPQPIQLVWRRRFISPFLRARWPHPVLCGRKGAITILPDHPHEGECIERSDIEPDREFDFAGHHVVEYPTVAGGRPLPEVIAHSTVLAGNNVKDPTNAAIFGAIGTYDGDEAQVGRVLVDATWHHFININLVGQKDFPPGSPEKALGFLSPGGEDHLEAIEEYFRNIAIWIAPESRRACMRRAAIWYLLWDQHLIEAVTPGTHLRLGQATILDFMWVGKHARDAIGRYAGQCQTIYWVLPLLKDLIPVEVFERLRPVPIPDLPDPPPDPIPWLDEEPLLDLALGGAVIALRDAYPNPNEIRPEEAEDRADALMQRGAATALRAARESMAIAQRNLSAIGDAFENISTDEDDNPENVQPS